MKAIDGVQEVDPLKFSQPRIAYSQALQSRFRWLGEQHTIGTCDLATLHAFLMHHVCLARLPVRQSVEISDLLSHDDEVARWHCVDYLLECKVTLPLEHAT